MTKEQFQRTRSLFEKAIELPPEQREVFVRDACPDDPEVLAEVLGMLAEYAGEAETAEGSTLAVRRVAASAGPRQFIGPYKLGRKIGEGGMGVVYKATQEEPIRREVALKLIKESFLESDQVLLRFESERQALARMSHPNVARVLDAGSEDGRPYFVMEYIRGVAITDYCDRHNLTTDERLELLIQVCEGLQHAHQKGIIHRDIKPSNILVEIQDDRPVPKIIDFGVAKATDQELTGRTLFTEYGKIIGTPEYMSPEQAEMTDLDIDTRTDVYSLGVVLYELLVGALPFDSRELRRAGLDEIRRKIREETPHKPSTRLSTLGDDSKEIAKHRSVDPRSLAHECQGDLDWITMKALEKDRTRRYASASEFAADLRRHLRNEPVTAGPPSVGYRMQKFVRRHRFGVATGSALVLLFLLGFAGTAYGLVRTRAAERQARLEAETVSQVSDFMIGMFEISDPSESRGSTITAREILDRGARNIRGELVDEPELQGRLMETMGKVYRSLGLYQDALTLLEESVESARRAHGDTHPAVASVMTTYAGALIKRRKIKEARAVLEEALRIQDATLAHDDVELARTLNNLGGVYRATKRYEEALPLYERSLEIRERALGVEHPDVAKVLSNIGATKIQLMDYDGAREALERALQIREEVLPSNDPVLAGTMNSLAELYRKTGRFELGRSTAERAIALQEKTLGPDHPDLIGSLVNLARIERETGELAAARDHLERALEIGEARLDAQDPRLRRARGELSEVYELLGESEKAAE